MNKTLKNIYCYVDESGQHTQGLSFSVAVIIIKDVDVRNKVEQKLIDIELKTKKGILKWKNTHYTVRENYVRFVMTIPELKNCLYYSLYTNTRDYVNSTVDAIVRALQEHLGKRNKVTVVIDGLDKKTKQKISRHLKQRGVMYKKVRGIKDEGSALIRLADAIAGFSRHVNESKSYTHTLYPEMKQNEYLIKL